MNILVTGGAGFIGSHACKALAAAGHLPIVYDNLRTGHLWAVKYGPFEHGDILHTDRLLDVMRKHRINMVMHFAALAYVGESMADPSLYYHANVVGTMSLLSAMRAIGVNKIILSSTCATFGSVGGRITEACEQKPINPYGASKLMMERVLADYAPAYGIGSVTLRYFNAAGADPDGELGEAHDPETHLIPIALQTAAGLRHRLDVFGTDYDTPDGTCVRDFIHVSDLAGAHTAALDVVEPGLFKAFNLGNGAGFSVREVISTVESVSGKRVTWRAAPRREGDPPFLVADATAARIALGWKPRYPSLEDMIAHAWAFMTR